MRRSPNEPTSKTSVFSSEAWNVSNNQTSYTTVPNDELKQYAATSIPQGSSRSAKTARHNSVVNAYYSHDVVHQTNSNEDPFQPAMLDTRHQSQGLVSQPLQRNSIGVVHSNISKAAPTQNLQAPQNVQAPQNYVQQSPMVTAPFEPPQTPAPAQQQTPAPAQVQVSAPTQAPTTAAPPAPPAQGQQTAPVEEPVTTAHQPVEPAQQQVQQPKIYNAYEPVFVEQAVPQVEETLDLKTQELKVDDIDHTQEVLDTQETIPDFELEFEQTKQASITTEAQTEIETKESEIDLSALGEIAETSVQFGSPALFSTGALETSSNSFFDASPQSMNSDGDDFYDDSPTHNTIQVDLEFISRVFKAAIASKIVIAIFAAFLAISAFFIVKTIISSDAQSPSTEFVEERLINQDGKTVITDTNGDVAVEEPQNVDAPAQPNMESPTNNETQDGVTVYRDQDGRVVYSGNSNHSFSG